MTPGAGGLVLGAAAWRFASPGLLLMLSAVPFVGSLLWLAFMRQRRGLAVFAGATPMGTRPSARRALTKITLTCGAASLMVLAVARPQADPIEEDATLRGRDIVFLVDVSRSMLARDVVPSRLERARLWISDLTATLRSDRVALVAFAGVPVVKCPLTLDYPFFRLALEELTTASSPRGGTLIGDAIRKALSDVFEPGPARYRDIILITDGEDQGSFPVEAAKRAGELGVRIIALGIGGELEGSPVPAGEGAGAGFVTQDGREVRSRLDSGTLAQITLAAAQARGDAGGGVFLNVGTGTIDLDTVYQDLIAGAEQRETRSGANVVYRELYPYFLGLALLCLMLEPAIAWRSRARREILASAPAAAAPLAAAFALVLAVAGQARAQGTTPAPVPPGTPAPLNSPAGSADDPALLYNTGRDHFLSGKFDEAAQAFRRADQGAANPELSARARFNLGQVLLKQATADATGEASQTIARLDAAARAFKSVLAVHPDDPDAARNVEIARRLMQSAQEQQKQQQAQQNTDAKAAQDRQKDTGKAQRSTDDTSKDQQSTERQQNADKLKDLAQRQSQAADASQKAQQEQDAAQRQAHQQQSQAQQERVNQDTRQERARQASSKDPPSAEARDKLDRALREQQAASDALQQGDAKSAEQHQREAARLLEQASQDEQKAAEQEPRDAEPREAKPKDDSPPRDQTAAQLLDKERRQREARQQVLRALRGRPQPVEKDW